MRVTNAIGPRLLEIREINVELMNFWELHDSNSGMGSSLPFSSAGTLLIKSFKLQRRGRYGYFGDVMNCPIFSFRNFRSAGLGPAPAVCPQSDGIGVRLAVDMNPASYFASPTGK